MRGSATVTMLPIAVLHSALAMAHLHLLAKNKIHHPLHYIIRVVTGRWCVFIFDVLLSGELVYHTADIILDGKEQRGETTDRPLSSLIPFHG